MSNLRKPTDFYLENNSQFKTIDCDCGSKVLLSELAQHKRMYCSLANVDCPYFDSGTCEPSCVGLVPRYKLQEHLNQRTPRDGLLKLKRHSQQVEGPANKRLRDIGREACFSLGKNHSTQQNSIPSMLTMDDDRSTTISSLTYDSPCPYIPVPINETERRREIIDLTESVESLIDEANEEGLDTESREVNAQIAPDDKFVSYRGQVNSAGQGHGRGRLEYLSGCLYEGEFFNDKRHGRGSFVNVHIDKQTVGGTYTGGWTDDCMHGNGRYEFTSGDVYEGQYHLGQISGQGKMSYADGSSY